MKPDIRKLFLTRGLRVTAPRLKVFDILEKATAPLSIADIIRMCPSVDRVSIYRTIDLFTRQGITVGIAHGWKQHYELAAPFRPHHHHLLCIKCGATAEVHSKELEEIVARIASKHNFSSSAHTFEITGLCKKCLAD